MYNGAFLVAMNGSYIDIKRLNNHYIILIMVIYYIMAAIIYIYHIYIEIHLANWLSMAHGRFDDCL